MTAGGLHRIDALTLTIVVAVLAAAAVEFGFRIGDRHRQEWPAMAGGGTGPVEGVVFGLFGLLIAFTFSFVIGRAELRRQLAVDEANAIETSYLRSAIAPAPARGVLEDLHRRYLASRVAFIDAGVDQAKEDRALAESQSVQAELWSQAIAVTRENYASGPYLLLLQALNEMFDVRSERMSALFAHLPDIVVVLLLVTALLTGSVTGYALGLKGERHPVPTAVLLILIAVVLYIILDIDRPRRGLLRTNETALLELGERLGRGGTRSSVAPLAGQAGVDALERR